MAFGNFEFPNANTYDSDLREVLRRLKELIDRYNIVVDSVEDLTERVEAVEAIADELRREWANLQTVINQYIKEALAGFETKFDLKLKIYKEEVDYELNKFDNRLKAIELYFDAFDEKLRMLKEYSDLEDDKLRIELTGAIELLRKNLQDQIDIINEILDNIDLPMIYNPLRARYETHETVVRDLYEAERYGGLHNHELEDYDLTNEEFAALNLCNYDIAINLRWIIEDFGVRRTVHPFYGTRTIPYNADSFLLTLFYGTMTNQQFIDLDLTNEDFEALDLTNADYLTYNTNPAGYLTHEDIVGFVNTSGTGLTNQEAGTLGIEV